MSSRTSRISRGEGAFLALVRHPSSDGVTIKTPHTPSFPTGLVKTEPDFIVRLAETGLGR